MSKPRTPTLISPASSPKWPAYYAREETSSTPISAAATNFPAGMPHLPTCHCAKFRNESSTTAWLARWTTTHSGRWNLISHQLPAFLRPFSRHFAGVHGTGIYNVIKSGDAEFRIYRFTKD
jgi:hypothetical protein